MESALKSDYLTVEEYLEGEEHSDIRHEYSAGVVFAMPGGTVNHNLLVGSLYSAFRAHQRGRPCRVFMENVQLHLFLSGRDLFYYPDVLVTCDPGDTNPLFKEHPKVVVEVHSGSTERLIAAKRFGITSNWNHSRNTSSSINPRRM